MTRFHRDPAMRNKTHYSIFSLARNALSYHQNWEEAWRSPEPKPEYDVIIVGGGGHGLATAYYLAKEHGITNVAVLEKGWIGGGNTGRNTTVMRSNYLWDESARIYEHALKLWEGLGQELNFNVDVQPARRAQSRAFDARDARCSARRVNAPMLNGIDAELLTPEQAARPSARSLNISPNARYPIYGASLQRRGGIARHDAVAWGYARAADALRRRHHPELRGDRLSRRERPRHRRRDHARDHRAPARSAWSRPGTSSVVAEMAGFRLPIQSHPLQALVSEPVKPILDTVVMSSAVHVYVSQSDKGELVIGAGIDAYNSYAQRGSSTSSSTRWERCSSFSRSSRACG